MAVALLNPEAFRQKIKALLAEAEASGRSEDVDRVVAHIDSSAAPDELSPLAKLMFVIDQEYQLPLQEALDGYRRWYEKKHGGSAPEAEIVAMMREVYDAARAAR